MTPPALSFVMTFEQYLADDAVSRSTLTTLLRKSAAHAQYELSHPKTQTKEMALGSAAHCLVLEPDKFSRRYALRDLDGRTTAGKEQAAKIEAAGLIPLNASDWESCHGMAGAVMAHPSASQMMRDIGTKTEVSLKWLDEATYVTCKARLDAYSPGLVWDLKTTKDASPEWFERTLFAGGYHLQGAFYLRGAAACQLRSTEYRMVAVEKDPPYQVAVYRLTDDVLQGASLEMDKALKAWAECLKTGIYPGYQAGVVDIGIPAWGWRSMLVED